MGRQAPSQTPEVGSRGRGQLSPAELQTVRAAVGEMIARIGVIGRVVADKLGVNGVDLFQNGGGNVIVAATAAGPIEVRLRGSW